MSIAFIASHAVSAISGSYGWGTLAGMIAGTASSLINTPADDDMGLSLSLQTSLTINASALGTVSALGAVEGSLVDVYVPSAALPLSILLSGATDSLFLPLSSVGLISALPFDTTYQLPDPPDTKNVIAHLLYGLSRSAISCAVAKVIIAAKVAAQPISGKAVLWLTGNTASAITAGAIAPALILGSSLVGLFYLSIK